MNIICMQGGLGNQMFQYALYLKLNSMGRETVFEDQSEYVGHANARPIHLNAAFGLTYPVCSDELYRKYSDSFMDPFHRIIRKVRGRRAKIYQEESPNFDPAVLYCTDTLIKGFFQTEKYFDSMTEDIRKAYTFTDKVKEAAKDILYRAADNSSEIVMRKFFDRADEDIFVSIHVRRGDYLDVEEVYGGICTEEYYERAVEYVLKTAAATGTARHAAPATEEQAQIAGNSDQKIHFFVFSNDSEWTNEWIEKLNRKYDGRADFLSVCGTDEGTGYIDMYLMSCCDHNIIANSSFSWWGAYLNNNPEKIVVAPSKWSNTLEQTDIYTKEMVLI